MRLAFERYLRRFIRWRLGRSTSAQLEAAGEKKLLKVFRHAAQASEAYAILLGEAGVAPDSVLNVADFRRCCPVLDKANTFRRFSTRQLLSREVPIGQLASILTSSGHGAGGYAIGLSTRAQLALTPHIIDMGLELAFDVDRHRTLLINCLPMGVTFQSAAVCVANVSVREDMACALVLQTGELFEQIVLCGDPLFLKRLCDYSQRIGVDWGKYRVHVILGEETFSESFRDYLGGVLGNVADDPGSGLMGSSMGVGELGLNLFNETRETIALRRACMRSPALLAALVGEDVVASGMLPTFLVFNPMRTLVEIDAPDANGIGDLLVSLLDDSIPVPLLRYKTGDRMKRLSPELLAEAERQTDGAFRSSALPVVALFGRNKDFLAPSVHVDHFKATLYQDQLLARQFSGVFRLEPIVGGRLRWHAQLGREADLTPELAAQALQNQLPDALSAEVEVFCYLYLAFPFGLSIDYERKFVYWPG